MCEGISSINGPIPTHPMFLREESFHLDGLSSSRSNKSICEGPSKISGPIPSDYGFESEEEKARRIELDYSKNPRVRDAGKQNFNMHKNGTVGFLIELQGRSIAPQPFKLREPPKNHIASNVTKVKQLMRKVKERETQKEQTLSEKQKPVKALWKSEKYKDVQSKVKEALQQQPMAPRETNTNFLRAHSRTGSVSRPQTARESPKESKTLELNKKFASKDDMDFIKHNQKVVTQAHMKRAPSVENLRQVQEKLSKDLEAYNNRIKGKVPDYLLQRKEELRKQQEEYVKNLPDPDQPPGHRKLPEDERLKTLGILEDTHKKLIAELNSMPIRNDTFRIKTTKSEMEKRLTELEEAIKIFSKPKVFVKIDG